MPALDESGVATSTDTWHCMAPSNRRAAAVRAGESGTRGARRRGTLVSMAAAACVGKGTPGNVGDPWVAAAETGARAQRARWATRSAHTRQSVNLAAVTNACTCRAVVVVFLTKRSVPQPPKLARHTLLVQLDHNMAWGYQHAYPCYDRAKNMA